MATPKELFTFGSRAQVCSTFPAEWEDEAVKDEPMFFNCTPQFAWDNGGPITRAFLDSIPRGWNEAVVDSRTHMLMPGWYPAIPGWHHDDVPRAAKVDPTGRSGPRHFLAAGQPDYERAWASPSDHIAGLVNAHIAPTLYGIGRISMPPPDVDDPTPFYGQWNPVVEKAVRDGLLVRYEPRSGEAVHFNCFCFHRAQPARENGWRWFIRISRNTVRAERITNEFRRQVQVYLEAPEHGW